MNVFSELEPPWWCLNIWNRSFYYKKTAGLSSVPEPVIHILEELPVILTCPDRSRMEISSGAIFQSSFVTRVTAAPERLEQKKADIKDER